MSEWHDWFQLACGLGTCVFLVLTIRSQNRALRALDAIKKEETDE